MLYWFEDENEGETFFITIIVLKYCFGPRKREKKYLDEQNRSKDRLETKKFKGPC